MSGTRFDIFAQDQRLMILKSLDDAGYDANEDILTSCLDNYGHRLSREQVRTHLLWLEEHGLVTVNKLADYFVATITQKGLDVAQGRAVVYGVKRPRPIY